MGFNLNGEFDDVPLDENGGKGPDFKPTVTIEEVDPELREAMECIVKEVITDEHSEVTFINGDEQTIEDLEFTLEQLNLLREDIESSNGINKDYVLQLESIVPGFINSDNPLGFYTKHISQTRYQLSLEEIDKKKAGIIAAIVAAVLLILWKIKSYFGGSAVKESGSSSGSSGSSKTDAVEEIQETNQEVARIVDAQLAPARLALQIAQNNDESKCYDLMFNMDSMALDMLTRDPDGLYYLSLQLLNKKNADMIINHIGQVRSRVKNVVENAQKFFGVLDTTKPDAMLVTLQKQINSSVEDVKALLTVNPFGITVNTPEGKVTSFPDILKEFKRRKSELENNKEKIKEMDYAKILNLFVKLREQYLDEDMNESMNSISLGAEEMAKIVNEIEASITDKAGKPFIATVDGHDFPAAHKPNSKLFSEMITLIRNDFTAMATLMSMAANQINATRRGGPMTKAFEAIKAANAEILKEYKRLYAEASETGNKAQAEEAGKLKKAIDAFENSNKNTAATAKAEHAKAIKLAKAERDEKEGIMAKLKHVGGKLGSLFGKG